MSKETVKKIFNISSRVLSLIIIAVTVFMMIFTLFSTLVFDRNDRPLFGYRFYVVLSDSMSPSENNVNDKVHFSAGDIVLSKTVKDAKALQVGDVISFISQNSDSFGETVTHMIHDVRTENGKLVGFTTYGTNTGAIDEALVEPEYVLGKYVGKLPGVGNFFGFLKTTPGYILCILIPFLLLILWQGVSTVRIFRQYKREQIADMEAERAQIAEEREQSAQMMRELMALREQLANQSGAQAPATTEPAGKTEAEESPSATSTDTAGTDQN